METDTSHYPPEKVRNIGIIAHIDAGKTTVTERLLYYTGITHRMGTVDQGNTVTDWMDQERERGITIVSAAISANWKGHQINLIDTPGHIDFTAEVQRALRVLDGAVVVFDAVHGVESQSETVWRQANAYDVPRICFVNKMDRLGANFEHALESIRRRLGAEPIAIQLPLGAEAQFEGVIDLVEMHALLYSDDLGNEMIETEIPVKYVAEAAEARGDLIEKLAEFDDELLEDYLQGAKIESERIRNLLRGTVLQNQLFPVLCGAALRNKGIQPLLDAVLDLLPSPLDIKTVAGAHPETNEVVIRPRDRNEPLAALVFKVVSDPYAGRLAYVRVYSGQLKAGMTVLNVRTGKKERIGRIVRVYADRREPIDMVPAGEIDALLSLKHAVTGETLCSPEQPIVLENIKFPDPVINLAIEPISSQGREGIGRALNELAEEDPTFKIHTDRDTGQTILSGMGELHLEVLVDRLRREHQVEVRTGKPRVSYKETITKSVDHIEGRYVHQTGGHGQYGHVYIDLEPAERGSGITFESHIVGGVIPREFIPAVEQGVKEAATDGVMGGHDITDVKVILSDGSYHDVDSSEPAFKAAGSIAFKEAVRQGKPVLLEPVFKLEVTVPGEYLGDVMGQLSARRCAIEGTEAMTDGTQVVNGMAPLNEMFGYATTLRSATRGRGVFTMEFDHYSVLPSQLSKRLAV